MSTYAVPRWLVIVGLAALVWLYLSAYVYNTSEDEILGSCVRSAMQSGEDGEWVNKCVQYKTYGG